ncbi:MAG: metal ABC transporter permease [Sphaerochaetaceae bacterium]|nr:metal ABC transporter permease [Sphaerochaetaceae bacterium]
MNTLMEALSIPVIANAAVGMICAGLSLSLVGTIIIPLHLVAIRFTLMHVGLFGAALALAFGINPTALAYIAVLSVSLLMGILTKNRKEQASSIGAIFMTSSLAGAFVVLAVTNVPAMEIFDIFAGNILLMSPLDVTMTVVLGLLIILFFITCYREIQLILLNPELAQVLGVPIKPMMNIIFIVLGLAVATALRLVGALLVDALIFLPAVAALRISRNFLSTLILTSVFGALTAIGGFLMALYINLPLGAATALMSTVIIILSYCGNALLSRR